MIWTVKQTFDFIEKYGINLPDEAMCQKNFAWNEFFINQHEKPTLEVIKNIFSVAKKLQEYRNTIFKNSSISITSGWRSASYNLKIGGAKNSYHIKGLAVDFVVKDLTPQKVQAKLDKIHLGGLEYAKTWTHIDLRGYKARF